MNTILTLLSRERLEEHYRSGFWRSDTIYSLFRSHAAVSPGATAVLETRRSVSYGDLLDAVDRLAADLHHHGLRRGDRVAVWSSSRVETALAFLACSRGGYVCCPSLHRDHTVGEVAGLVARMRAAAFIGEKGYGADVARCDPAALIAGIETLRFVHWLAPASDRGPGPYLHASDATTEAEHTDPPPCADADAVVYLAFTSGTTGGAKGVLHSNNTLLANSRAIASDWGFQPGSVLMSLGPLSHNLGFGAMINALTTGATLSINDFSRGRSLLDTMQQRKVTFLFGVPTHGIDLLKELKAGGLRSIPGLKGFRISGASLPPTVCRELLDRGIIVQSGYGMTEACSHNYTLPNDPPELIEATSGRACAGYEIQIWSLSDCNVKAAAQETGQIGGRGASLMLGYFDDQVSTEEAFNRHGWFMTGDLGWMDENGYLRVTGRQKELIIRGGHNIFPAKIEELAMHHQAIARAAVVPVPDQRLGERVCLVIVARPGGEFEPVEVLRHLRQSGLSKYEMPEFYVELDDMPRTPSGKILKRQLTDWIAEGRLKPQPVRFPDGEPLAAPG